MNRYSFFVILIVATVWLVFIENEPATADHIKKKEMKKLPDTKPYSNKEFQDRVTKYFSPDKEWTKVNSTSQFLVWIKNNDYQIENGKKVWNRAIFEIDPAKNYDKFKSNNKTVVVFPIFTDSAYNEPGFYTTYRKECNSECLTVKIQNNFLPQANPNTIQVLKLLGYPLVTDVDVDKDPAILKKYDKVIILHNEYVTKKEFVAITTHPNVLYLFPNSLYAEIKSDYVNNTITLVKGHDYPKQGIRNGFDWKFDNSQYEYDRDCKKMQFYRIDNGWMLNCYPQNMIHKSTKLLEAIRKL